jgi:predicted Zn-dependent peptidase
MNFTKRKLNNGITVIHEPRNLPLVSLSITNKFGAAYEESKIKGIAHFIEHLLFTGTKNRTHEDISREIEKKGGILNAFTSHQVTSFWFKLPSEHIFTGLDVLTDMLNNPKFEKEKFEKEKKVVLEEIKMYHDDPRRNVMEQIEKNMYESPFGELVIGKKETVSGLERDFVEKYYYEAYSPENYIVTIVGQADLDKVCEYLEKNFTPKNKTQKHITIKKKNSETTEERAGVDQANFIFAVHAPLPSNQKHHVLEVLDCYLANGMSSRLFLEIREKRGLAYAVKSGVDAEKDYSFYFIYVGTTKEAVLEVKKLIIEEFKNINEMTEKDLQEAKERIIGLKKVLSEESSNVMNELMFHELNNDVADYYKSESKINAVTLEQVKELSKELVKEYSSAAIVPK